MFLNLLGTVSFIFFGPSISLYALRFKTLEKSIFVGPMPCRWLWSQLRMNEKSYLIRIGSVRPRHESLQFYENQKRYIYERVWWLSFRICVVSWRSDSSFNTPIICEITDATFYLRSFQFFRWNQSIKLHFVRCRL